MTMVGKRLLRTLPNKTRYAVIRWKRSSILNTRDIVIRQGSPGSGKTQVTETTMPELRSKGNLRENGSKSSIRNINQRRQWVREGLSRWRSRGEKEVTVEERQTM